MKKILMLAIFSFGSLLLNAAQKGKPAEVVDQVVLKEIEPPVIEEKEQEKVIRSSAVPMTKIESTPKAIPNKQTSSEQFVPSKPLAQSTQITLRLELNDIKELQKIAKEGGGDLVVQIQTLRMSVEDLIVPLLKSGRYNLNREGKALIVTNKIGEEEVKLQQLSEEITKAEMKRDKLLQEIQFLDTKSKTSGIK